MELSQPFKDHILKVKSFIKSKNYNAASSEIKSINDETLSERELAEKYNIWGMVYFYAEKYDAAKNKFTQALTFNIDDQTFNAQLMLNLASCDYKLGLFEDALERAKQIDDKLFQESDKNKLFLLIYASAKELRLAKDQYLGLLLLNSSAKDDSELMASRYYKNLQQTSQGLNADEKIEVLSKLQDKKLFIVEHEVLSLIEFYREQGDLKSVEKLQVWIGQKTETDSGNSLSESRFINYPESWEKKKIGIVLPLSGEKADYSRSVLMGLVLANDLSSGQYELVVRDSQDVPSLAQFQIEDLVKNEHVSLIIGGLFSSTNQQELKATTQLATTYIALAPIYLSRQYKESLVFEMAGSVESQVRALMSEETQQKLGKRFAVFYPDDQMGALYVNEFWNSAPLNNFQFVNLASFSKNLVDYRDYAKDLFGLKFSRERAEEYALWYDIRFRQYKDNIQRAQILPPKPDFDWLFIPSNPLEIVQIIPSFQYLEVSQIKYVGGPQWRSGNLVKNESTLGELNFVDTIENEKDAKFQQAFKERYEKSAGVVELLAFDALWLAHSLLNKKDGYSRTSFRKYVENLERVESYKTQWAQIDHLWIKKMGLNKISADGISKL